MNVWGLIKEWAMDIESTVHLVLYFLNISYPPAITFATFFLRGALKSL